MNCRSAEHLFSSFVEDELSQRERRSLENHLTDCPRCSQAVEELRATVDLLTALPSYETGPAFEEEVMDRIRSGEALRPGIVEWISERVSAAWLRPVFLSGAAASALYIAFLVGSAYMPSANPGSDASKIARVTPPTTSVAPSTTPAPARVAPAPVVPSNDAVASASSPLRRAPAGRAPSMNGTVEAANTADSASAAQSAPYQDEYILDQFYLNRSGEEGVHSIVPVSGRSTDDVYITF
jgi:anti-sigma factor RsiW